MSGLLYFETHKQEFAITLKNILDTIGTIMYEVVGETTSKAKYMNAKARIRFLKRQIWEMDRKFFGKEKPEQLKEQESQSRIGKSELDR